MNSDINLLNQVISIYTNLDDLFYSEKDNNLLQNQLAEAFFTIEKIDGFEILSDELGKLASLDEEYFEYEHGRFHLKIDTILAVLKNIKSEIEQSSEKIDIGKRIYSELA